MKTHSPIAILLTLLLGAIALPLTGCENRLTKENYDMIQ